MENEKQLLLLAKRYDLKALTEIYNLYSPGLYRYAVRLLNDPDFAEECVAESFSRFLSSLINKGGPEKHLRAYIYRIAHNWITDQYRQQTQHQEINGLDHQEDPNSATSQLVDESLEKEKVRAAILTLTPDQRQVIVLKYLEGWSNVEVAATLNKPVGAVKSLQHRALETLRTRLSESDNS